MSWFWSCRIFRIKDGDTPVVWLEHFSHLDGGIEIDARRTVVLRSMETYTILTVAIQSIPAGKYLCFVIS